ncbi:hypothetical protein HBI62_021580 [Parastagonospora nodorum]|nr:hypothetical protein HBH52_149710 [Parastagonospora nodorum]KAH4823467.1 hypothetical protein HBH61_001350 [Parastagonospora nodorum]KAH5045541.1 hypothetical protein HBI75_011260 [Parastagonospora nodorum]KAH5075392.1 hypothetical protein HBH95_130410 [Parastagonospora nodorum]KAH5205889.1 hypothetical protein HBH68_093740 [Parastagonospora nodorum]
MSAVDPKAIYVDENGDFSIRDDILHKVTAPNDVHIEVIYSGVNPADTKHAHLGIRSTVIGYDFCGRVLSVPSGSKLTKGDIVAGYTPSGMGRPSRYGTHQAHCYCPEDMIFSVPSHLPQSHAAAITVVAMTAADTVFNIFKLPLPTSPAVHNCPIVIWGASSSVGICALQFLKASGCQNILVTASLGRHELLKSLGATHTFDYNSLTVEADIAAAVQALGQGSVSHALDAAGTFTQPSSADMLARAVNSPGAILASVTKFHGGFQMPLATTKDEWRFLPPGAPEPISIPGNPERHWNAWTALEWAIKQYNTRFMLPSVEILDSTPEAALDEIIKVGNSGRGFGKLVVRQPMKQ